MSDPVLKSPLLTGLNFKYSQDSVIRFIGKRNVPFFDCHQVPEETLVQLINYAIEQSDESFHVSYYTYKAGVTLFITHDKLVSKPFWFNQMEHNDLFRASDKTSYLSLPLTASLIEEIDKASKTMKIKKAHLMILATLTEYSPNPWGGDRATPFDNLIDCALNIQYLTFDKFVLESSAQPKNLSWAEITDGLKKIVGENCYDEKKISEFIVKARKAFAEYKTNLKFENLYNDLKYTVSAYRADGQLVHQDQVPIQFSLRNLDALFAQNLEYYKHVLYLEIHDPFEDETFVYYPTLTNIMENDDPQSIFFSISSSFFNWLMTICGASLRSRNSTLRQAVHNFITNWQQQWEAIPLDQLEEAQVALAKFKRIAQDFDDPEPIEEIKRPRGRPRINPPKEKKPRGRPPKNAIATPSTGNKK